MFHPFLNVKVTKRRIIFKYSKCLIKFFNMDKDIIFSELKCKPMLYYYTVIL